MQLTLTLALNLALPYNVVMTVRNAANPNPCPALALTLAIDGELTVRDAYICMYARVHIYVECMCSRCEIQRLPLAALHPVAMAVGELRERENSEQPPSNPL